MMAQQPGLFWILGRGGMLGASLETALAARVPEARVWRTPVPSLSWTNPQKLQSELEVCARRFFAAVEDQKDRWGILWAAGAGVIGTSPADLSAEADTWELLLRFIAEGVRYSHGPGLLFLASSAGGVFGQCSDACITETSPCNPISTYGQTKKRQEESLHSWAARHADVACCIGRISNLYGIRQKLDKPQGLISHVSRCILWQQPVRLYVPLDTIRDYIYVDDCAAQIAMCIGAWLTGECKDVPKLKIFAAEEPTSVAQVIGSFMHLGSHRHPRIICAPNHLAKQQPRRLLFRSVVPPHARSIITTPLQIGIATVHHYQTQLFCKGLLKPPPIA